MRFELTTYGAFKVEHCVDCAVPGYLIVSPAKSVTALSDLSHDALVQLGPILSVVNRAIQTVVSPVRIYSALFAEKQAAIHFHVFPRTDEVTREFLRTHPEQIESISGPVLLDWARIYYRAGASDVWEVVSPTVTELRAALATLRCSSV